jgi:hypothetical protein
VVRLVRASKMLRVVMGGMGDDGTPNSSTIRLVLTNHYPSSRGTGAGFTAGEDTRYLHTRPLFCCGSESGIGFATGHYADAPCGDHARYRGICASLGQGGASGAPNGRRQCAHGCCRSDRAVRYYSWGSCPRLTYSPDQAHFSSSRAVCKYVRSFMARLLWRKRSGFSVAMKGELGLLSGQNVPGRVQ